MSEAEARARTLLTRLRVVGVVGTNRPDGWPHLVPVWYRFSDDAVNVWTTGERVWVRNAAHDPRVSVSVQETAAPFAAVVVRGDAEIVDNSWPGFAAEVHAICARYLPVEDVDGYVRQWPGLTTIVRIRPRVFSSWEEGY